MPQIVVTAGTTRTRPCYSLSLLPDSLALNPHRPQLPPSSPRAPHAPLRPSPTRAPRRAPLPCPLPGTLEWGGRSCWKGVLPRNSCKRRWCSTGRRDGQYPSSVGGERARAPEALGSELQGVPEGMEGIWCRRGIREAVSKHLWPRSGLALGLSKHLLSEGT